MSIKYLLIFATKSVHHRISQTCNGHVVEGEPDIQGLHTDNGKLLRTMSGHHTDSGRKYTQMKRTIQERETDCLRCRSSSLRQYTS